MQTHGSRVRQVTDPDIGALLRAHGALDARQVIRSKVDELLLWFADFEDDSPSPLDRIKALASLAGLQVRAAVGSMSTKGRAAMFVPAGSSGGAYIVYDSTLPTSRIVYSIAHEIIHTFIPSSTAGVRFRSMYSPMSKPVRHLEMLCEYGASLLIMPEGPFAAAVKRHGFSLQHVDQIRAQFGTSFEATTYRVAQTAPFPAAAVKVRFRFSKKELQAVPSSGELFPSPNPQTATAKYRCQSFHRSDRFPGIVPFNKSFPAESCVYKAAVSGTIESALEFVPVTVPAQVRAFIEAIRAPYQPDDADPEHPDVLGLMRIP